MARKRPAEYDFICRRCECPCDGPYVRDPKHLGGGQNRRACRKPPLPVLRSEYEAEMAAFVDAVQHSLDRQRSW
jgi:hypothetical protein